MMPLGLVLKMSIGSNQNLIEKDEREFTQIEKQKKFLL